MNKTVMIVLVVILLVILGGAGIWVMGNKKTSVITSETPAPGVTSPTTNSTEEMVVTTGNVKQFTVEGSGFKFVPATMTVKQGDTVQITFKNVQGMHDFVLDEFEVKTNVIGADEEEQVEFVASKTGTFEYYCSVGNHRAQGMMGTLIVE